MDYSELCEQILHYIGCEKNFLTPDIFLFRSKLVAFFGVVSQELKRLFCESMIAFSLEETLKKIMIKSKKIGKKIRRKLIWKK